MNPLVLVVLLAASAPGQTAAPEAQAGDVLAEIDRVRADPASAVPDLERMRGVMRGDLLELPGRVPIRTEEGAAAVDDAIAALRAAKPSSPLRPSPGMDAAAREHADDLGRSGRTGHVGHDGSHASDRLERHGAWEGSSGEAVAFGSGTARDVVLQLLVDDGVPGRGHRRLLLDPRYRVAGVACGPHPVYHQVCVIDVAAGFRE